MASKRNKPKLCLIDVAASLIKWINGTVAQRRITTKCSRSAPHEMEVEKIDLHSEAKLTNSRLRRLRITSVCQLIHLILLQ